MARRAQATLDKGQAEGDSPAILSRLRQRIARELHDYPYPIAGCDEAFKLLALQRELVRVALGGLAGADGLTPGDAAEAIRDLLATPLAIDEDERQALAMAAGVAERTNEPA